MPIEPALTFTKVFRASQRPTVFTSTIPSLHLKSICSQVYTREMWKQDVIILEQLWRCKT